MSIKSFHNRLGWDKKAIRVMASSLDRNVEKAYETSRLWDLAGTAFSSSVERNDPGVKDNTDGKLVS